MELKQALITALECIEGDQHASRKCGDDEDAIMLAQAMEQIGKLKAFLYPSAQERAFQAGADFAKKERSRQIRQWLSEESLLVEANGKQHKTPPEYPWFGCKTDRALLDAVDAEMVNWGTQIEALKVMYHG